MAVGIYRSNNWYHHGGYYGGHYHGGNNNVVINNGIEITLIITIIVETHLIPCAITRTGQLWQWINKSVRKQTYYFRPTVSNNIKPKIPFNVKPTISITSNRQSPSTSNRQSTSTRQSHQHQTFLLRPGPVLWRRSFHGWRRSFNGGGGGEGVNSLPYFIKE
jgi:hypothetical protein